MPRQQTEKVREQVREFYSWAEKQPKPFLMAWCKLVYQEKGYSTPGAMHSTMRSAGVTKDTFNRYNCFEGTQEERLSTQAPGDRRENLKYGVQKRGVVVPIRKVYEIDWTDTSTPAREGTSL